MYNMLVLGLLVISGRSWANSQNDLEMVSSLLDSTLEYHISREFFKTNEDDHSWIRDRIYRLREIRSLIEDGKVSELEKKLIVQHADILADTSDASKRLLTLSEAGSINIEKLENRLYPKLKKLPVTDIPQPGNWRPFLGAVLLSSVSSIILILLYHFLLNRRYVSKTAKKLVDKDELLKTIWNRLESEKLPFIKSSNEPKSDSSFENRLKELEGRLKELESGKIKKMEVPVNREEPRAPVVNFKSIYLPVQTGDRVIPNRPLNSKGHSDVYYELRLEEGKSIGELSLVNDVEPPAGKRLLSSYELNEILYTCEITNEKSTGSNMLAQEFSGTAELRDDHWEVTKRIKVRYVN